MKQSGNTVDGLPVFEGVFKLVGTQGVPLELILQKFKDSGWVVDWIDYIKNALKDGHNPSTIKSRILSAVGEIYGPAYCSEINTRLIIIMPENAL